MNEDFSAYRLKPSSHLDAYWLEHNQRAGEERCAKHVPERYATAVPDHPLVAGWVGSIVAAAEDQARAENPVIRTGQSLLILGPVGTGKTYQAFGAVRALSSSGAQCRWRVETAAGIYAALRPRPRHDTEADFEELAAVPVLVVDDLGAAKSSEWTEEINYRLVNHRYEHRLPTIVTSNIPAAKLGEALGERVTSRLVEMAQRVSLLGDDRRRNPR